jgi:O-acetyl-ADP-ribose deacetylase (regulator of RNase III)
MNATLCEYTAFQGTRLLLVQGDITEERVDAIVNAANSHLEHGDGVAGVIVRKGGREIQRESDAIGYVPVGEVAVTGAGALPCRVIIHAVGPRWGEGGEEEKLRRAVWNSLAKADERGFQTLSLPAISSGIYGFPKDRCAEILLATTEEYLGAYPDTVLKQIRFCLFDPPTVAAFQAAWRRRYGE